MTIQAANVISRDTLDTSNDFSMQGIGIRVHTSLLKAPVHITFSQARYNTSIDKARKDPTVETVATIELRFVGKVYQVHA